LITSFKDPVLSDLAPVFNIEGSQALY